MENEIRNFGTIGFPEVPPDKWIAGAVAITLDENGNYDAVFHAQSAPHLPAIEVREELGALLTQAWSMANCPGIES